MIRPEPIWEVGTLLGEGPVWIASEERLRFVDIKAGQVHSFHPATGARDTLHIGGAPSFILPADDGSFVVGSGNTLYRLSSDGDMAELAKIPEPQGNRTNDACADQRGRLWFGTMDNAEEEPVGAIWSYDRGVLQPAGPRAVVTNGPAASRGDRWIFHCDSGGRTIWRHPLGAGAKLSPGEIFIEFAEDDGFPDGIIVDAEDCLWVAMWDGWCVRRYSPGGELLLKVEFPCARVTKMALGGPDLCTAYVTTARVGLSDAELKAQRLAGSLFTFRSPAPGQPVGEVRLCQIPREVHP